jgi:membrane-anchored protein YejM (alkaline phosphatase superfamily)
MFNYFNKYKIHVDDVLVGLEMAQDTQVVTRKVKRMITELSSILMVLNMLVTG